MAENQNLNRLPNYKIRIQGHFDPSWEIWFDDLMITCEPDGNTLLWGYIPDQPALYGLITRLQNMGITLISINQVE